MELGVFFIHVNTSFKEVWSCCIHPLYCFSDDFSERLYWFEGFTEEEDDPRRTVEKVRG